MKTNNKYTLNFFSFYYVLFNLLFMLFISLFTLVLHFWFYFHPTFLILLIMLINFSYGILSRLKLIYLSIGCSFKISVKGGVEESIVNALRITDHGSAV
jgi:hypothetical protein